MVGNRGQTQQRVIDGQLVVGSPGWDRVAGESVDDREVGKRYQGAVINKTDWWKGPTTEDHGKELQ